MTIIYDNHSSPRLVKFECNTCHKQFERGYGKGIINRLSPRDLKQDRHYCELACSYLDKQPRKSKIIKCDTCGLEMRKAYSQIKKTNFCSMKCYGIYKSTDPKVAERSRRPCSEETKRKIGKANKEKPKRFGILHTQETKDKISKHHKNSGCFVGEKNPMFGKKHSTETKEKMSEIVSREIISGQRKKYGNNNHVSGDFKSLKTGIEMHYRSSWELACMKWLDTNDNVSSYDYEAVRIPYYEYLIDRRYKRHYVPDFIIEYKDGHKEMWEIKPQKLTENEKTRLKELAADEYCATSGIQCFKILCKQQLQKLHILT